MNNPIKNIAEWLWGGNKERVYKTPVPNQTSKHSGAKQPKRDAKKRAKVRRKMAKESRRINRGKR